MAERSLTAADLQPPWQPLLSQQRYAGSTPIEGVQLLERKVHSDDGGTFVELGRLDDAGQLLQRSDFQVRQVNVSELLPGTVKAWHLHFNQEDLWYVPPGDRLLVGLKDLRAGSATAGQTMRLVLGGEGNRLLYIPRGVAHGAANPWSSRCLLIYLVNQQFSSQEPDEWRLPWDACGAEFWTVQKG